MTPAAFPLKFLRNATDRRVPPLLGGEVHLWSVVLRHSPGLLSDHAMLLSDGELRRADSFRFDIDRNRFIAARGTLRRLLAAYTGGRPGSLAIETNPYGKPFLTRSATPLNFNLAHSQDQALIALSLDSELGVDLEVLRNEERVADLADSICSTPDRLHFETLPIEARPRALLRIWTAKEAFLKSTGLGLQVHPTRLETSPGVAAGLRNVGSVRWIDAPQRSSQFRLYPLPECERRMGTSAALVAPRFAKPHRIVWMDGDADRRPTLGDAE